MITFILLNSIVILSSLLIVKKLRGKFGFADFVILWFFIYFTQIILVELLLGILNRLYLWDIFFVHFIILCSVAFNYRAGSQKQLIPKPDLSFVIKNKLLLFSIAIFLSFFLIKCWINLINPPVCPDSLQYHLSFPATWMRNGNLINPIVIFGSKPTSAETTAASYYPINAELFFFWLMLPFKNAFLADIGQAPFYFIGILAVYSILRKFSIKKETALLVGVLWGLIPNVFKEIRTGSQIDVICVVLFLWVIRSLLLMREELSFKTSVLLGVSSGVFIGTKVLNIFWLMAIIPLFTYFIVGHKKENTLAKICFNLTVMLIMIFLCGGFSYIRTFLLTGNPFYPVSVVLFGKSVFPGIIDKASFSKIFVSWDEFSLRNMFFGEGLGLQFLAFIFPGTLVPLIFFKFFKKKVQDPMSFFWLFCIPAFMFFMYLFYIKAYWIRYIFPYLAIGFICAVIFLDKFKWGQKYITIIGFISLISSAAELAHRQELITSLVMSLLLFLGLLLLRNKLLIIFKNILLPRTFLIVLLTFLCFLSFLNGKYNKEEFFRYALLFKGKEAGEKDIAFAWKWLNENTGNGKRIAYTGRNEFYPLFGSKIKNAVLYISVNDKPNLPHYYPDGIYRREKSYLNWRENLEAARIDFLFVALPYPINNESNNPEEFPIEDKWAQENPKKFRLVFNNNKAKIYSLVK